LIAIAGVLASPYSATILEIIKTLKEFIEIKINLKGEKPKSIEKEGDKKKITNTNGDIYYIENVTGNLIVNNVIANEAIADGMRQLQSDKTIEDFEIENSNKSPIVKVEQDSFKYFSPLPNNEESEKKQVKVDETHLNVFKIVFDVKYKWEFLYKGIKISAKITDKDFQDRVKTGERFANGDILHVKLQINQFFDLQANTFVNKSYEVMKVIKHIPRGEQLLI
jgi:hypothetical protein